MSLLIATLQMMALTFGIGFIVAGIIKTVALCADYFEFHHSHSEELKRLKKLRKMNHIYARKLASQMIQEESYHGVSKGTSDADLEEYYHNRNTQGSVDYDLMDYYYPGEERIKFMESLQKKEKNKKNKQ